MVVQLNRLYKYQAKMFIKTGILSGFLILAVGFNFSHVSAASMEHHHDGNSHGLALSTLNVESSNDNLHYCPVNGEIMEGPVCEMGLTSSTDTDFSDPQNEYFIAAECGGHHPFGSASSISQFNYKVALPAQSNKILKHSYFSFINSEFIHIPQEFFDTPYKPPKLYS